MTHGLPNRTPLQSSDGSKVKIEDNEILTKDSTAQELLYAQLAMLREIKEILLEMSA